VTARYWDKKGQPSQNATERFFFDEVDVAGGTSFETALLRALEAGRAFIYDRMQARYGCPA
jgi:hypothetical protein